MKRAFGLLARFEQCPRGSTAVEFAIVCFPLILLCLGIVEFGRALNIRSDMAYAADIVTRAVLISGEAEEDVIAEQVREAFTGGQPENLSVTLASEAAGTASFNKLTISYPLALLVPGLTSSAIQLTVERLIPVAPG